jgi:hypothetical protein
MEAWESFFFIKLFNEMKGTEKSNRNFCQGNEGRLRMFKKTLSKRESKGLRNLIKTFINKME